MPETVYLQTPLNEAFESRDGWQDLGNKTFSAVRADIVIVKRRESKILKGPPVKVLELPGSSEYSIQQKNAQIVRYSGSIQRSIQETVTAKLAQEVAAKIASEVGATGVLPSAKLSSEVQSKTGLELTEAVQSTLSEMRTFEVQNVEEITRSISYKPSPDGKKRDPVTLQFYLGVWPWRWEFYLHRVDYLRLRYQRNWIWPDVRKTISSVSVSFKLPLFSLRIYEPQDEFSISETPYVPDVTDEREITIEELKDPMPKIGLPPASSLEDLARLAFPVTKVEKSTVAKHRPATRKARKPAFAKRAARKARARKR